VGYCHENQEGGGRDSSDGSGAEKVASAERARMMEQQEHGRHQRQRAPTTE
jgi:hypothetical protein